MSLSNNEVILDSEESVLSYTHAKRLFIVESMLHEGQLPEDPAEKKVLLNALDGMDKMAIGRMRIKIDEKANKNMGQAAALVAQLLSSGNIAHMYNVPNGTNRDAPLLGSDVPAPDIVNGETAINPLGTNYEEFMNKIKTEA